MMRTVLAILSSATCATILTACALLTSSPAREPVTRDDAARVACGAFQPIPWALGDEAAALGVLRSVQTGARPATKATLDFLREIAGDTNGTVIEIKGHNAAYKAICPTPRRDPRVTVKGWEPGRMP